MYPKSLFRTIIDNEYKVVEQLNNHYINNMHYINNVNDVIPEELISEYNYFIEKYTKLFDYYDDDEIDVILRTHKIEIMGLAILSLQKKERQRSTPANVDEYFVHLLVAMICEVDGSWLTTHTDKIATHMSHAFEHIIKRKPECVRMIWREFKAKYTDQVRQMWQNMFDDYAKEDRLYQIWFATTADYEKYITSLQ